MPVNLGEFDAEIAREIRKAVVAIERSAGDAALWRDLGTLYLAHDQIDLAAECYRQSLALAPGETRTLFYLALADHAAGRPEEAIAGMRRVVEARTYTPARWRLGLWLLDQGQDAEALVALQGAVGEAEADPSAHHALARAHLQAGSPDQAATGLESWLENRPEDHYARFLLGSAYRQLGRAEEAQAQLALGQSAQPSWSDPWSMEVEARRTGYSARLSNATELLATDPGKAIRNLEELRRDRPESVTTLINLGIGYRRLGRLEDSAETLREAVRLEPARGLAHFHLALTLSEQSRTAASPESQSDMMARALEHAVRTVELQPNSPRSHAMHGELLARAGQTAEAAAAYGRAAIDPQDPAWLLRLGDLLCQLKRWQEAIPIFDEFLALSGDNVEALLLRGVALANTGRVEAARASLEQALALSPGDSRVRQALDQLEGLEKRAASQ